MAITSGSLARIKASQEDVFVLAINDDGTATVRRPVGSSDGIKHLTETFTQVELESTEDARTRELAERFALQQKFAAMQGEVSGAQQSSMQ